MNSAKSKTSLQNILSEIKTKRNIDFFIDYRDKDVYIKANSPEMKEYIVADLGLFGIPVKGTENANAFIVNYNDCPIFTDLESQKERAKQQGAQNPQETKPVDIRIPVIESLQSIGIAVWLDGDGQLQWFTPEQQSLAEPVFEDSSILEKKNFLKKVNHLIGYGPDALIDQIQLADKLLSLRGCKYQMVRDIHFDDSRFPQGRSNPLDFSSPVKRNAAFQYLKNFLYVEKFRELSLLILPRVKPTIKRLNTHSLTEILINEGLLSVATSPGNQKDHFQNKIADSRIYLYFPKKDRASEIQRILKILESKAGDEFEFTATKASIRYVNKTDTDLTHSEKKEGAAGHSETGLGDQAGITSFLYSSLKLKAASGKDRGDGRFSHSHKKKSITFLFDEDRVAKVAAICEKLNQEFEGVYLFTVTRGTGFGVNYEVVEQKPPVTTETQGTQEPKQVSDTPQSSNVFTAVKLLLAELGEEEKKSIADELSSYHEDKELTLDDVRKWTQAHGYVLIEKSSIL